VRGRAVVDVVNFERGEGRLSMRAGECLGGAGKFGGVLLALHSGLARM